MKKETVNIQKKASQVMKYEDALSYIEQIYGPNKCSFDEDCVVSFEYIVSSLNIISCYVTYDRIAVKIKDDPVFYWPIHNHREKLINGETVNLFDKIKRKHEERNAAS